MRRKYNNVMLIWNAPCQIVPESMLIPASRYLFTAVMCPCYEKASVVGCLAACISLMHTRTVGWLS
jgi:hypothetical protein